MTTETTDAQAVALNRVAEAMEFFAEEQRQWREDLAGRFEQTKAAAAEQAQAPASEPAKPVVMREVAQNSENSTEWRGTKATNLVIAGGTVVVSCLAVYQGELELAQWLFATGIGAAAGVQGLYNVAAGLRKGMAGKAR